MSFCICTGTVQNDLQPEGENVPKGFIYTGTLGFHEVNQTLHCVPEVRFFYLCGQITLTSKEKITERLKVLWP